MEIIFGIIFYGLALFAACFLIFVIWDAWRDHVGWKRWLNSRESDGSDRYMSMEWLKKHDDEDHGTR